MEIVDKAAQGPGKFIVVEGLDGSGKTIQAGLLAEYLASRGFRVNLSAEPTDGPVGSLIRQVLRHRIEVDPRTLAGLFASDRLDHNYNSVNGIAKHLEDGIVEISDRYDLTSYAYQALYADKDWVWQLNSQSIRPDLTIFLDVSPQKCRERLLRTKIEQDLFHHLEHLSEARDRYFDAIEILKRRETVVIIDGDGAIDEVSKQVLAAVRGFLETERVNI